AELVPLCSGAPRNAPARNLHAMQNAKFTMHMRFAYMKTGRALMARPSASTTCSTASVREAALVIRVHLHRLLHAIAADSVRGLHLQRYGHVQIFLAVGAVAAGCGLEKRALR